jgi:hypothetical protein
MSNDHSKIHALSGWIGHAGPNSSMSYLHIFEKALARTASRARPMAWREADTAHDSGVFESLDEPQRRRPDTPQSPALVERAMHFELAARRQVAFDIAAGLHLSAAASGIRSDNETALEMAKEIVETLVLARLVEGRATWEPTPTCNAIAMFFLWARAARQAKLEPLRRRLDGDVNGKRLGDLVRLWHAWRDCLDGEHFSLSIDRSAHRIVDYMLGSGISRSAMLIVRPKGATGLGQQMTALKLPVGDVQERAARSTFRLQVSEPDVRARDASGASLSVVGLHWEMVLLGSLLLARGAI